MNFNRFCHPMTVPARGVNHVTTTPPVDRILDTRFWKYYLAPTSLRAVKMLKEAIETLTYHNKL